MTALALNPAAVLLQRGTVDTALGLLTDSQADIGVTLQLLVDGGSQVDERIISLISQADSRADDVCGLARRLLLLLRSGTADDTATAHRGAKF